MLSMKINKSTVFRFTDRNAAFRWSIWVILGDDEKFWVCTPADFDRFIKAGYESAR
jgi:hypothetical protein